MQKTALITGASSGIGRELARIHAEHGGDSVILARSGDKLRDLKSELEHTFGVTVEVLEKDLSIPGSPAQIFEELHSRGIRVEYLLNNAGFGDADLFHEADWNKLSSMITVNITALTALTRLYLPEMVRLGRGHIMNVASTAAFFPGPYMAVYYASKHYVFTFSQSVAEELKDSGVTVTALCPGPTKSGFQARAGMKTTPFSGFTSVPGPGPVAEFGYRSMMRGKRIAVPGFFNKSSVFLSRLMPRKTAAAAVKKLQSS